MTAITPSSVGDAGAFLEKERVPNTHSLAGFVPGAAVGMATSRQQQRAHLVPSQQHLRGALTPLIPLARASPPSAGGEQHQVCGLPSFAGRELGLYRFWQVFGQRRWLSCGCARTSQARLCWGCRNLPQGGQAGWWGEGQREHRVKPKPS